MWAFSLIFFFDHFVWALCSCLLLLFYLFCVDILLSVYLWVCFCVYGFLGGLGGGWWNLPASIDSNIPNPSIGTVGNLLYMWYLDIFGIWCIFCVLFLSCCYKYKYEVYEFVCVYVKPRRRRSWYCDVVVYCLFSCSLFLNILAKCLRLLLLLLLFLSQWWWRW